MFRIFIIGVLSFLTTQQVFAAPTIDQCRFWCSYDGQAIDTYVDKKIEKPGLKPERFFAEERSQCDALPRGTGRKATYWFIICNPRAPYTERFAGIVVQGNSERLHLLGQGGSPLDEIIPVTEQSWTDFYLGYRFFPR